jgi:hypothetical protein
MSRLALVVLLGVTSCLDPVHVDDVAALGPEPGGPPGPTHRPGQPCLTCHGGRGPADLELSIGGTVYQVRGGNVGAPGITVVINDGTTAERRTTTNDVGNFYFKREDWDVAFPLDIYIVADNAQRNMTTRVGRDGSCATCHRNPGDTSHMPGIYVREK